MAAVDPLTFDRIWSPRGCDRASAEASAQLYHGNSLQFELHLISQAWIWKSRIVHSQSRSLHRRRVLAPPSVPESTRFKTLLPYRTPTAGTSPGERSKDTRIDTVACPIESPWLYGRELLPETKSQRSSCVLRKRPLFNPPCDSKVDLASEEGFIHQAKGKKKKGSTSNNYSARDNRYESNGNDKGSGGSGRDLGNNYTDFGGTTGGRGNGDDDDDRSKHKDASEDNEDDPRAVSTSKQKRSKKDILGMEVESIDRPKSVSDAAPDPPDVFDDVGLGESPGKLDLGFSPHEGKSPFGAWGQKWNTGWGRSGSSNGNFQGINGMEKKLSIDLSFPDGDTPKPRRHDNLSLALDDVSESEGVSRRSKDQSRNGGNAKDLQANEDSWTGSAGAKKSKLPVPSRFAATSEWPVHTTSTKDRKLKRDPLAASTAEKTALGSKGRDESAWGGWTNPTEKKTIPPDPELMENVWTSGTTRDKLKKRIPDQVAEPAVKPTRQRETVSIPGPMLEKAVDDPWGFRSKPPKWEKKEPKLALQTSPAVKSLTQASPEAMNPEPITTSPAPTRDTNGKEEGRDTDAEEEEDDDEDNGGLWAALSGKKEKKKKRPDSFLQGSTPPKPGDDFWDGLGGTPKDSAKVVASPPPPVEKEEGWSFWGFGSRKKKTETPLQTPVELPPLEKPNTFLHDPTPNEEEVPDPEQELNEKNWGDFQESVKEKSKGEVRAESRERLKTDQKEERTKRSILEDEMEILSKKEKRKKKSSLDRPKEEVKSSKSKRSSAWDDREESTTVKDERRKASDAKPVDIPLEKTTAKRSNTLALEPFKSLPQESNLDHWGFEKPPRMAKDFRPSSWKPDDIEEPTGNIWNLNHGKEDAPRSRRHDPVEIVGAAFGEIVQPDDVEEVKDSKVEKEKDGWAWTFSSERKSQPDKEALAQLPPRAPTPPSFDFHMSGGQAEDPNKVTGDERSSDKSRSRSKEKDRDSDREKERHKKDKAPKLTEREMRKLDKEKKRAEKAEKERLARESREAEERERKEAEQEAAREVKERARREAEEEAAREAEELLAREAKERAAREAEEQEARAAEELAEREAEEEKAREAEEEAAEQAARDAEAAAIIEEEEEMEALREKKARRGKLTKRDSEKLHRLEQNALRRAREQAAREAARKEEERIAREAEEQAAREAEAAIIAMEEAEIAALVQKNSKKGKLGRKDAEKLHRLEQDALRRADERAARERMRAGENEDDDEAPEGEEEDELQSMADGQTKHYEELDIDTIRETETDDQEDEEQLAREAEEVAREAAETAAREAAREAEEQAAREAREARKRAAREAEEAAAANKKLQKSSRSKDIRETRARERDREKERERERESRESRDKDKKDRKSRTSSKSVAAEPATKPDMKPVAELEEVPSAGPVAEPVAEPMANGPGPDAIPEPETLQEHKRELSRLNEAEVEELLSPKEISISNAFNFWGLAGSRRKQPVTEAQRKYPMDDQLNEEKTADSLPSKSVSGDGDDALQESPSKDEDKARPGSSDSPPAAADEPSPGEKPHQDDHDLRKDNGPDDEKPPPEIEPPRGDGSSSEEESSPENEASSKKVKAGAKKSDDPSPAGADKARKKAAKSEKHGASPRESGRIGDRPESKDAKERATAEAGLPSKGDRGRDRERVKDKDREKDKDKEKRSSKKQRPRAPADEALPPPPGHPDLRSAPHAEPRSKRPTLTNAVRPSSEDDEPLPRREEKRSSQSKTERPSRARADSSADKPTQKERPSKATRPRALTANEPLIPRAAAAQESRYDPRAFPGGKPSRRYSTESHGLISPPPEEIPMMASKAARIFGVDRLGSRLKSRKANPRDDDVLMVGALGNDAPLPPREKHRSRRTLDEDAMMPHGEAPGHPPLKRGLSGLKKGGLSGLFGFMAPKPSKIPSSPDVDAHIEREFSRDVRRERRPEREDRLADDLGRPKEERDRERHRRRRDDSEARRQAEKDARRERRAARQREEDERREQEDREARKAERHRQRKEREREKEREIEREREERKREGDEAEREAKRQRRKSLVEPSGDETERQRRYEAKRASRAAEEPDPSKRRDHRKYSLEDQIPSNREGRREVRRAPAAWPHMGLSSWVKDHSGAMPPPDSGEQTDGMAMTEDDVRREERRSQRRREKAGEPGPEEERRRQHKREGRERDAHDRHAHERQGRDRDGRDGRDGRERTKRVVRSDGSDERYRSRREAPVADSAQRGSWWKKWTA